MQRNKRGEETEGGGFSVILMTIMILIAGAFFLWLIVKVISRAG